MLNKIALHPRRLARNVTLGLILALGAVTGGTAMAQGKTIKFVPEADLRILDPIWTTAYITRNHGYMVYDVLFATDADFKVQPQMVDKWELSPDKLTYTFTLRDGLKFHDGAPVRSADCIASIERWAKRDVLGQKLGEMTESWTAVDDKTFKLKLKKPFALTLESLAKPFVKAAAAAGIKKSITPRAMRRTFQDVTRAANVESVVKRSISGHATEEMEGWYSTVAPDEQRVGLAKVIDLMDRRAQVANLPSPLLLTGR